MANPFSINDLGAAIGKFMPGQHAPFGAQTGRTAKPYEKKKPPVKLGPPRPDQIPKKRKKKALTS